MKYKLYLFVESPLSDRDYKRFGIKYLNKNFELKVFDFSPVLRNSYHKNFIYSKTLIDYILINRIIEIKKYIIKSNNIFYLDYLGNTSPFKVFIIRTILAFFKYERIIISCGIFPQVSIQKKVKDVIGLILKKPRIFLIKFMNKSKEILLKRLTPASKIAVISGSKSFDDSEVLSAKHKIYAHSFDYENFLNYRSNCIEDKNYKFALFLDEDMAFHVDYLDGTNAAPVSSSKYFLSMNNFFDEYESVNHLSVVVAAHPRSKYKDSVWNGRKVVRNLTAEYVERSSVVFCHSSTSVSYPVLWRKPIIFLTSNELILSWYSEYIKSKANCLNMPIINIDKYEAEILSKSIYINECYYKKYIEYFIKYSNSPNIPLWEIFHNELIKITK